MTEEKKSNKNKTILAIAFIVVFIIGWFSGSEYKKYQLRKGLRDAFSGVKNDGGVDIQKESKQEKKEMAEKEIIEKQKGDIVELATINIKVEEIEEMKQTTREYGSPGVADEGAKFVLVKLSVTNTTKAPFEFEDSFVLIDESGTKYNPAPPFSLIDDYLKYKELQPNIAKTGYMIFQVPENLDSYSLGSSKKGTDEYYKIKLK
ncbi:MAG: DUF4352 domain-containing protein [Candidatus Moranbacteria bacterium]|nr:DUF4352 domain-containing protein [Candidatus Moranbacteria bacterium]